MKEAIAALFLIAVVLAATPVLSQGKTEINTVNSTEVNNRVVIVAVQEQSRGFKLQWQ